MLLANAAMGKDLPTYCKEDPDYAEALSGMGPVLGLGSSVSHGLMANSISGVIADQLCLGNQPKGHAFPLFLPVSYTKVIRYYYKSMKPNLVLALDITYHKMKITEGLEDKKKELEALVAGLALDCDSDLYDCSADGNESYAGADGYRPTVLLGDVFFEKLIDCNQRRPLQRYSLNGDNNRPEELCFDEYLELNRYIRELAAKYPNVHLLPANRLFTALQKYPRSLFYDEGRRQTFFSRQDLTWDGWHPWTDPGSYVFANMVIMQINRLIEEGKIKGRPIPLKEISDKYFDPPSGLIILAPQEFPKTARPRITGPDGQKIPLRFSLPKAWAQRHGVFSVGTSYYKARALAWARLGPKPLVLRARSSLETTLVLSKKDQDMLTAHYRNGISLKGGLILRDDVLNAEFVTKEEILFLNQVEKDKRILEKLSPPPMPGNAPAWDY